MKNIVTSLMLLFGILFAFLGNNDSLLAVNSDGSWDGANASINLAIEKVCYSHDGKYLVYIESINTDSNQIVLQQPDTNLLPIKKSIPKNDICDIDMSKDASKLVIGYYNGTLEIWDLASLSLIKSLMGLSVSQYDIKYIAFSSDGIELTEFVPFNLTTNVWNWNNNVLIHKDTINKFQSLPFTSCLSKYGDFLAAAVDSTLIIWDIKNGKYVNEFHITPGFGQILQPAVSSDGKYLAYISKDQVPERIRIRETESGKIVNYRYQNAISIAFSNDDSLLAILDCSDWKFNINLWHFKDNYIIKTMTGSLQYKIISAINKIYMNNDYSKAVTIQKTTNNCTNDSIIYSNLIGLYDFNTSALIRTYNDGHRGPISFITVSPNNWYIATQGYSDGRIIIWDAAGNIVGSLEVSSLNAYWNNFYFSFSPDSRELIFVKDMTSMPYLFWGIEYWSINLKKSIWGTGFQLLNYLQLPGEKVLSGINQPFFLICDSSLISEYAYPMAQKPLVDIKPPTGKYFSTYTISADGTRLYAITDDFNVYTWNLISNSMIKRIELTDVKGLDSVKVFSVSNDGKYTAFSYKKNGQTYISVWDNINATGIDIEEPYPYEVKFIPKTNSIFIHAIDHPSLEHVLEYYDFSTQKILCRTVEFQSPGKKSDGHAPIVTTPNGKYLVIGDCNGTIHYRAICDQIDDVEETSDQINAGISASPNPAIESINFKFYLEQPSKVSLKLTDMLGNQISLIDNQFMDSGSHSYDWDASGKPAGVYYYVLQMGGSVRTGKVVIVR
jgi:WD40 repeat protein